MNIISLFGAKHGVGVTTTAALLATAGPGRVLIAHDVEDVLMLLGYPQWDEDQQRLNDLSSSLYEPSEQQVLAFTPLAVPTEAKLRTARFTASAELMIMDWGTSFPLCGRPVLVTDNSYIALRRAIKLQNHEAIAGVICILERTRPLQLHDVEKVIGRNKPVIGIERDSSIQRACDAGLLSTRIPAHASRALEQISEITCSSNSTL